MMKLILLLRMAERPIADDLNKFDPEEKKGQI